MAKSSPITCKVPWPLLKRIQADASEHGITVSEWQRRAAEEKLQRVDLSEQLADFEERLAPAMIRVGDATQIILAYLEQLIKTVLTRVPMPMDAEAAKAAAKPAWSKLVETVRRQFGDEQAALLNGNGTHDEREAM